MSYILTFLKHQEHYISWMSYERLHGEERFRSKKYLLEVTPSHSKMRMKSAPEKLNFVMAKAKWKSYTLDCNHKWTFTHSYAASFSLKVVLSETNIIFYSQGKCVWHKMNNIFWKYIKTKDELTLDSFWNFAYVSSYLRLKSLKAWKRYYLIS